MRYIIILLFISTYLSSQTVVDSFNTSKNIQLYDGSVIAKDSVFRRQLRYVNGTDTNYIYVDTLIMRISYLNIEANLWTGDNETSSSINCGEACSYYTVEFTGFRQTPNIVVANTLTYVEISVKGWYDISYGTTVQDQNSNQFNAALQLSKANAEPEGYYNSIIRATCEKDGFANLNGVYTAYFNEGNKIYMLITVENGDIIINPYLNVKRKL